MVRVRGLCITIHVSYLCILIIPVYPQYTIVHLCVLIYTGVYSYIPVFISVYLHNCMFNVCSAYTVYTNCMFNVCSAYTVYTVYIVNR